MAITAMYCHNLTFIIKCFKVDRYQKEKQTKDTKELVIPNPIIFTFSNILRELCSYSLHSSTVSNFGYYNISTTFLHSPSPPISHISLPSSLSLWPLFSFPVIAC